MTPKEFTDRTGLTPTPEEFRYIHAVYMDTPMDKDVFCKDFKAHGTSRIIRDIHVRVVNLNLERDDMDKKINETVELLLGKSRAYNDSDFRNMAIRLIGENKVVLKTIEMNLSLFDEDREYIMRNLNSRID